MKQNILPSLLVSALVKLNCYSHRLKGGGRECGTMTQLPLIANYP